MKLEANYANKLDGTQCDEASCYVITLALATGHIIPHFSGAATGPKVATANVILTSMSRHAKGHNLPASTLKRSFSDMADDLKQMIEATHSANVATDDNVRFQSSFAPFVNVMSTLAIITNPTFYKNGHSLGDVKEARRLIAANLVDRWEAVDTRFTAFSERGNPVMAAIWDAALNYNG